VNGKILDMMPPFKVGWKIYDVPVYIQENHGFTFYTEHIDLFAFIAIYLSYGLLGFGLVRYLMTIRKRR